MGGRDYDRDVDQSSSTRHDIFTHSRETYVGASAERARTPERKVCDPMLDPKKAKKRECCDDPRLHPVTMPIVLAMDVTRSRGEDAVVIYKKLPKLIYELIEQRYLGVAHPVISFAAIGDASAGDQAPLQVGQFEADKKLDTVLSSVWLEEGGGGTGQESYELAAYFYAKKSVLDCNKRGEKGIFFFIGDEAPYEMVKADQVKAVIGDDIARDIPSQTAFAELSEKYRVYFIYQQKSERQLKRDVDAEIEQRVKKAGGMHEGVDIRASLLWNNRNDLDLHVITPGGFHIYYGDKKSPCGGYLDVDMNVQGETTKPVENVRWAKGKAKRGRYRVFVRNFRFHERSESATEFRVELEVNGEIHHFSGKIPAGVSGDQSDVEAFSFDYDPAGRQEERKSEVYAAYQESAVLDQWRKYLPSENILTLSDPKGIVDLLLGVMALTQEGSKVDLKTYLRHMKEREQTPERCSIIEESLKGLSASISTPVAKVPELPLSARTGAGRSRRL